MGSCAKCRADLPDAAAHCPSCDPVRAAARARSVVFPSREDLKERFETLLAHHGFVVGNAEVLPLDTKLSLELVLPEDAGTLTVIARVVGARETPCGKDGPYELQLQLLDFDAEKQATIRALLAAGPAPLDSEPLEPEPGDARLDGLNSRRGPPEDSEDPMPLEDLEPLEVESPAAAIPRSEPPSGERRQADELKEDLTNFTVQFVQAATKTSYYTADHEESEKAKRSLYAPFSELLRDQPEVTFYLRTMGEKHTMLVYGIFDEPTELSAVMREEMAEVYTTKLAHFFEGNSLSSLSLKRSLGEEEFHRFVNLLAQVGGTSAETLAEERIHNISVVFQMDRVAGRQLSWRVQMALTRLRKDLSVIPLYRHLNGEELQRVQMQVFGDVVRPLRNVDVLRELLENCDLALQRPEDAGEEQVAELESQILAAVPLDVVPELLCGLAADLLEARREGGERFEMLQRVAQRVSQQVQAEQVHHLEDALRLLLANEVLTPDELPPFLQEKLALERKAAAYLESREEDLRRLACARDAADYQARLDFLASIFPILLACREFSASLEILERVAAGRARPAPFEERPDVVDAWMERLVASELAEDLPHRFEEADHVGREFLLKLCRLVGEPVLPTVCSILRESGRSPTRQALTDLLVEFKRPAQRFVSLELQEPDLPLDYLLDLLGILERVGDPDAAAIAAGFREHPHSRVRRTALLAVCHLDECLVTEYLVPALADPDPEIRETVRGGLFQRRSLAPALFEYCARILSAIDEENQGLARRICADLAVYDEGEGRSRSVALLRGVLGADEAAKGGWLSKFSNRGKEPAHVPVRIAACHSLGRLRATEAVDALARFEKCGHRSLEQAAVRALEMIRNG